MKGRDEVFKCIYCGKFIGYKDIGTDKINSKFIPDTEFTIELTEFWHTKCKK